MPAIASQKPHNVDKDASRRGLGFFGFMRSRRSSNAAVPVPPHTVKPLVTPPKITIDAVPRNAKSNTLDNDNAPLAPPPTFLLKYSSSASSASQGSLTAVSSSDEESAAAAVAHRRTRRLSKPPPSPTNPIHQSSSTGAPPSSPLSRASLPKSPSSPALLTPPSSPNAGSSSNTPSPSPPRRINANQTKLKPGNGSVDSSGRPRPPISGVKSASSVPLSKSNSAHTYHYKRARASSTATPDQRTQDAVLCLEALLDACSSGAVTDMHHVIEQVGLARKILVGEDDAVGGGGAGGGEGIASDEEKENSSGLTGRWIGKLGMSRSGSVTSLATLSNLVG